MKKIFLMVVLILSTNLVQAENIKDQWFDIRDLPGWKVRINSVNNNTLDAIAPNGGQYNNIATSLKDWENGRWTYSYGCHRWGDLCDYWKRFSFRKYSFYFNNQLYYIKIGQANVTSIYYSGVRVYRSACVSTVSKLVDDCLK